MLAHPGYIRCSLWGKIRELLERVHECVVARRKTSQIGGRPTYIIKTCNFVQRYHHSCFGVVGSVAVCVWSVVLECRDQTKTSHGSRLHDTQGGVEEECLDIFSVELLFFLYINPICSTLRPGSCLIVIFIPFMFFPLNIVFCL